MSLLHFAVTAHFVGSDKTEYVQDKQASTNTASSAPAKNELCHCKRFKVAVYHLVRTSYAHCEYH